MRQRLCVTHHDACDCREELFAKVADNFESARKALAKIGNLTPDQALAAIGIARTELERGGR